MGENVDDAEQILVDEYTVQSDTPWGWRRLVAMAHPYPTVSANYGRI
jgi:hypothetical protein